jgi:hypothetical protein
MQLRQSAIFLMRDKTPFLLRRKTLGIGANYSVFRHIYFRLDRYNQIHANGLKKRQFSCCAQISCQADRLIKETL